jgi:hypothetical protein
MAVARRIAFLARLPIRSIDLIYSAGESPFEAPITFNRGVYQYAATIHRVGLKNRMWATVKEARVHISKMEPDPIGHLPLPLRIMHSDSPRSPLTLHRGREALEFADVLGTPESQDLAGNLVIFHALPDEQVPMLIPRQNYRLQIRATSLDARPTDRWFRVTVGDDHVGFMPED